MDDEQGAGDGDAVDLVAVGHDAIDRFLGARRVKPGRQGERRIVAVALVSPAATGSDGKAGPDGKASAGGPGGDGRGEGERLQLSLECTPRTLGVLARVAAPRSVPRDRWPAALMACNHWNRRQNAARAVLVTGTDQATIVVEGWLPPAAAIPDDQVARFVGGVIAAGRLVWTDPRVRGLSEPTTPPAGDGTPD